ncbi:hypothetical protein DSL72_005550 [Monilinia vaccinii-corymbosi]|uniref:Uncharacterized protein n=1 Tax=Monilinia vaccinii-corymbosi TaxID=61207 RepID=A0A8A3PFW9_9HELO|nr:hypothetical protein DSL72_005550 [Monilinia vaccinii-corymbosi]
MSADIQRSNGRSSCTTGPLSDAENNSDLGNLAKYGISTVIIASEWHFKPAGVMEVEKRFAEKLGQMRALSSERHLLPLLQELNRITKEIIIEEGGDKEPGSEDDDDDDDEDDTYSDSSTEFHSNLIEKVAHYEPFQHTSLPNLTIDDVFYPEVVKKFDYREIWRYYDGSLMNKILKLTIVQELELITGSKIVKSPSESKVYIGSDNSGSVDLVMAKLDNIEKYSLTNTSFYHIFYTEEIELCKFAIKPFPEIKKKFLETTLMEQMPFPEYLSGRLTVRACPWSAPKVTYIPMKLGKYTAAISSPGAQVAATKLWTGFTWKPHGMPKDDPEKYFPNGYIKEIEKKEAGEERPKNEDTSSMHVDIEGWVENASTTADPSQKLNIEELMGTVDMRSNPLARLAMASEPEANIPNNKANNLEWKGMVHEEMTRNLDMPLNPEEDSRMPVWPDTKLSRGWPSLHEGSERTDMQSSLLDSALDAELTNSDWNTLRNNASENALIDISSSPTRSPDLKIFQMSDNSNAWGVLESMALGPPALSPSLRSLGDSQLPSEELQGLMTTVSASMASSMLNPGNETLIPMDFPELPAVSESSSSKPSLMSANAWPRLSPARSVETSGSDTIGGNQSLQPRRQLRDEASSRVFHKSMGQKASPNKEVSAIGVPEPQECFLRDFAALFGALMAPVRGFHGKVKIHLDFGRILLGNLPVKIVSKGENSKPWEPDFITRHLCPPPDVEIRLGDGPELFFTNVLSRLEADVIFLSHLKNRDGSRLWSEKSTEWKVTYEFTCEEMRTGKLFTIEIDAETFETHIIALRQFGEIDVHGTMRHWDLKLAVEGIEDEEEIRDNWPGYDDLAKEIQRTLYIPPGNEKPNHAFKVPQMIMEHFVIYHLKIRKTRTYDSLDRSSKLHITEVDKSCGHELPVKGQGILVYHFPEEKNEPGMEKSWHEASITSVTMNKLLQQNVHLELGEEVSWTVPDLAVKRVSNTLIEPACAMLAQMDGVGFYNDV